MVRIFGGASEGGLAASAFSFFSDHQAAPPRAASTTTAASRPRNFMPLPPAPPDREAGSHDDQGQENHAGVEQGVHLALADVQAAIVRVLGANRDQILVGAEPVHHVQKQVAISVEAHDIVHNPVGTAHDDETAFLALVAGVVVSPGGGESEGTFLVGLRI